MHGGSEEAQGGPAERTQSTDCNATPLQGGPGGPGQCLAALKASAH